MATIKEATRMCKRIMLTNLLTNDYSIAVTPLLSGKHGIGKSQVAKSIARDIGGVAMTIEGGTLKEGEITGIPYQSRNEQGEIQFQFLPYYIVQRIQDAERYLCDDNSLEMNLSTILNGEENRFSSSDLTFEQKLQMICSGAVKPVVLFFDEINRTDTAVFRELMNIILTRTVNGYRFPWWVFIIAAMNPSTQSSMYATNEMDPAQLDRFIKIRVKENVNEWLEYAVENHVDKTIIDFIAGTPNVLAANQRELDDDEDPTPSPRGWNMLDLILRGRDRLDKFFTASELKEKDKDIRAIFSAKIGSEASVMYSTSLKESSKLVLAEELLSDSSPDIPEDLRFKIRKQSTAKNSITSKSIITYLKDHLADFESNAKILDAIKRKLAIYIGLLDSSSTLLFAQSLADAETDSGAGLYDYFFDIFDDELLDLLQRNNMNDARVSGEI